MNHCLIMGFGRSGTSLMGGILHHSGYFLGDNLYPPRESNPLGFFENDTINGINEAILAAYDQVRRESSGKDPDDLPRSPFNPGYGQRWLSYIEPGLAIECADADIVSRIRSVVAAPGFAYKDPRFNYTLPVWDPLLPGGCVKICMFRHPDVTVESVIRDCATAPYLQGFEISREMIYLLWENSYRRVLGYQQSGFGVGLIFVHYEQLLTREKLPFISSRLGKGLDDSFITPELSRSKPNSVTPAGAAEVYRELCHLAGYKTA